jgi:hypothetical protein
VNRILALLAVATATVAAMTTPAAAAGPVWLVKANDLTLLEQAGLGPALEQEAFSPPSLVGYGATSSPYPGSSVGTPARIFTSYAALQKAFAAGWLPGPFHWVVLDLEAGKDWPTPRHEAQHPGYYEKRASQLTHSHGMRILCTPARDLARAATPVPADWNRWYLSSNQAGMAAKYSNGIVIQAQRLDLNVAAYAKFTAAAAKQAREANPRALVLGGLSTAAGGIPTIAAQLEAAYSAVYPSTVAGFWLNVPPHPGSTGCAPQGCPQAAIGLLAAVYG